MNQTIKVIEIKQEVVGTCNGCLYCEYDAHYGRSYDSGYDCSKTGQRIADDWEVDKYQSLLDKYEESLGTLFPLDKPTNNPMKIPNTCPLPDKVNVTLINCEDRVNHE